MNDGPEAGVPAAVPPANRGVAASLRADARWRWWEYTLLAVLVLSWWLLPGQALLLNEIAILALFAMSLDLILGYAGIVSLGHAAFFGFGGYGAALLLGVADVAGKYYIPKMGAFIVYSLMIVILLLRPQGLFARGGGK